MALDVGMAKSMLKEGGWESWDHGFFPCFLVFLLGPPPGKARFGSWTLVAKGFSLLGVIIFRFQGGEAWIFFFYRNFRRKLHLGLIYYIPSWEGSHIPYRSRRIFESMMFRTSRLVGYVRSLEGSFSLILLLMQQPFKVETKTNPAGWMRVICQVYVMAQRICCWPWRVKEVDVFFSNNVWTRFRTCRSLEYI